MTVLDAELPYSLIDLSFSLVVTIMGAACKHKPTYFLSMLPFTVLFLSSQLLSFSSPKLGFTYYEQRSTNFL
jgi:hypothetical protein